MNFNNKVSFKKFENKINKVNNFEKLRNKNIKSSEIYKLTFGSLESIDSEEEKIEAELEGE